MKKLFACLTILALLLTACAAPEYDAAKLEYPGIPWGSSIDEVLTAIDRTAEQIHYENTVIPEPDHNQNYWEYLMLFQDMELFGLDATAVFFTFHDYSMTGEHYVLVAVDGCFPEDTDMEALAQTITERYGDRATENVYASWDSFDGEIRHQTTPYEDGEYVWDSQETHASVLTQEQKESIHERYCANHAKGSGGKLLPTVEQLAECFSCTPACRIKLTPYFDPFLYKNGMELSEEQRSLGATNCRLTLSCTSLDWIDYVEKMMTED